MAHKGKPRGYRRGPLEELRAFWSKVDISGEGCWEWQGAIGGIGYGAWFPGERHIPAHRYSYIKTYGVELNRNQCVCHRCDNPACVRPGHLFVGSHRDNARDRTGKGRNGKWQGRAQRATAEVRREIRRLRQDGIGTREIAKLLNRSERGIRLILSRELAAT